MLHWLRRTFAPTGPDLPDVPADQWIRVEARLPYLDFLAPEDRPALRELARTFIATKQFHGAHELQLDDDMLLEIALQACLPVLKLGLDWYDDWVGIVIYPGDFIVPRQITDEAGVVHEYDDTLVGEAWAGGPVLLSWQPDQLAAEGINVVIHEFAHKLDMRNGEADGLPPLHEGMSVERWAKVWSDAYARFCADVDAGIDTGIDDYAAENPAEFFAVMSECFFEIPDLIEQTWPDLYRQLSLFYRLDPAPRARALYPPAA
ncbi:M90 family metallopeptidase [Methyloversatilis thermotolerans]|uniref:M90 family metallopeptidase n=1 Tax=Methyloversatilis thermotolerans TaxID=1346290 RepID=UPI0003624923|nr:M90 family metallopeptidase [Methyloversatilis thermotolerans]